MKKLLLLIPLLLSICLAFGLMSDYTFVQGSETYTEITGGTVVATGAMDDNVYAVALPFTFTLDETSITAMSMSANGWLGFNAGTSSFGYVPISSTLAGAGCIAVAGQDLQGSSTGEMRFEVTGVAPNRIAVYQWKAWRAYGSSYTTDNWNFQIKLYETSNNVAMVYGPFTFTSTYAGTVQVGMRGSLNTNFIDRQGTAWATTTPGTLNTSSVTMSSVVYPASGLKFNFNAPVAGLPPNPALVVSPVNGGTNIAINSTLNWASGGGMPTGYKLYFDVINPPINYIGDLGAVTTYNPGTLAYSQTYYWQVIPYNGIGDATGCPVWSFTTGADPTITTFPYTQGFDNTAAYPPYGWTTAIGSGTYNWTNVTSSINPTTTPYAGAAMLFYQSYNASTGSTARIVSPPVSCAGDTYMYTTSFWMYRDAVSYPSNADLVNVFVNTTPDLTGTPTLLGTINRYYLMAPAVAAGGWYNYSFDIGAGTTVPTIKYVILQAVSAYGDNMTVDEFALTRFEMTAPPNPAMIGSPADAATGVLSYATLNWSSGGGAPMGYKLYFGTDNPPTNIVNGTDLGFVTTYNPTPDMAYNTTYYWQVVPYNGGGDAIGCPVWSFTTAPDPTIVALPYSQNFDGVVAPAIPYGWTIKQVGGGFAGIVTYNYYSAPNCAELYNYNLTDDLELIGPPLDAGIDMTNMRVRFWMYCYSTSGAIQVGTVDTPGAGGIFTPFASITPSTTALTYYTVPFTGYAGTDRYIAFKNSATLTYLGFFIDNVLIEEIPTAPILTLVPTSWDFGLVAVGGSSSKLFTVTNSGGGTLTINDITIAGSAYYTLSGLPTFPIDLGPDASTTFTVQFAPLALGAANATVTISDSRTNTDIPLSGSGALVVNMANGSTTLAEGETWGFYDSGGPANAYQNSEDYVYTFYPPAGYLVHYDFSAFDSESGYDYLYIHNGSSTADPFLTYNGSPVTIPPATSSHASGAITFRWHSDVSVTYAGWAATISLIPRPTDPIFSLDPTSWDFGPVAIGAAPTKVFTIMNSGGGTLTIGSINITGTYYTLSALPTLPINLLGGESTTFTVQYTPTLAGGPYAGNVEISDNRTITNVPLTGSAYEVPTLPLTEGFESGWNNWIVVNGTQTNQWYVGTAIAHNGLQSAYISSDAGATNSYNNAATSVVHFYKDILFPSGSILNYNLGFWWNVYGEVGWDEVRVHLVDPSITPVAGTELSTGLIGLANYNGGTGWTEEPAISIPNTVAGTVQRLVFTWDNDSSIGDPPVAIDDISLVTVYDIQDRPDAPILVAPADLSTNVLLPVTYSWTRGIGGGNPTSYTLSIADDTERLFTVDALYNGVETGTTATPAAAYAYSTTYYWALYASNSFGDSELSAIWSFTTEADPSITTFPYIQTFESTTFPPSGWSLESASTNVWLWSSAVNGYGTTTGMGSARAYFYGYSDPTPFDMITPLINLGTSQGMVSFDFAYATYVTEVDQLEIMYSTDGGLNYTSLIVYDGGTDGPLNTAGAMTGLFVPTASQWGTMTFLVPAGTNRIKFRGISAYGNDLFIDNITIQYPLDWDAAAQSINLPEVVGESALTPTATVRNNGLNTATFDVTMTIGTWTNTQTVTALASGATAPVTFASYTPVAYTAETVSVQTFLVGDENPANDLVEGFLICLPLTTTVYADVAYDPLAVNSGPSTFTLDSPGTITDLDPMGNPFTNFLAGADWILGNWVGVEYNAAAPYNVWQVDTATGAGTLLGTSPIGFTGIAYDAVDNIVYGMNYDSVLLTNNLYSIDPVTQIPTLLGTLTGDYSDGLVIGLAYDNFNGLLYALDIGYDAVFIIDPVLLTMTPLGFTTGFGLNYAQSMMFDNNTGLLYIAGYSSSGFLAWVDPTTGICYKIGDFQNGAEVTGACIPWGANIEAPVISVAADGTISWAAVPGAASYNIYSATDPYGTFSLVGNTTGTSWLDPLYPEQLKFYYVTATDIARTSLNHSVQIRGLNNLRTRTSTINRSVRVAPAEKGLFKPVHK